MNFWAWMYIGSVITYIVYSIFTFFDVQIILVISLLACLFLGIAGTRFLLGTLLLILLGLIILLNMFLSIKRRTK